MSRDEASHQQHVTSISPGPTLERNDPQDPGIYHSNPHTDLPEHHNPQDEGPHVVKGPDGIAKENAAFQHPARFEQPRRICGVHWKVFWTLVVVALLFAIISIGAGLGAALAVQKRRNSS